MSFAPAADMQRTIQRLNALPAMMSPYSSSDSSALESETRCSDDTILVAGRFMDRRKPDDRMCPSVRQKPRPAS